MKALREKGLVEAYSGRGTFITDGTTQAVRQSLAFLLGSAGLTVRLYDSASAFLAGLSAVKSGCLVTDMRMPDMTGIELLHQMRMRACNGVLVRGRRSVQTSRLGASNDMNEA